MVELTAEISGDTFNLIKERLDSIIGSKKNYQEALPSNLPFIVNKPLKEEHLFDTTDILIYEKAAAYIYSRLVELQTEGVQIEASEMLLFDPEQEETVGQHELKHAEGFLALRRDPNFISLMEKYKLSVIPPSIPLSVKAQWFQKNDGSIVLHFVASLEQQVMKVENFDSSWDSQDILKYLESFEMVGLAPLHPSDSDYEAILAKCDRALSLFNSQSDNSFSDQVIAIRERVVERNKKETEDQYLRHKRELEELVTNNSARSMTAKYFSGYIREKGIDWIFQKIKDTERVLNLIKQAPNNVIHNPQMLWIDAKL